MKIYSINIIYSQVKCISIELTVIKTNTDHYIKFYCEDDCIDDCIM